MFDRLTVFYKEQQELQKKLLLMHDKFTGELVHMCILDI